ncbi:hypothetical protein [Parapedobacter koreensis]|uniref:Uncharacterized protein n=1 Tax=Parapedobacter koreensis TaxID=332977 RepID=A0A1H7PAB6_9SPHI|nr:hypothetical protein [Parapedobacter koreensis]SEL32740.1 hypothetical protein SAMN05421740_104280 [Parapedobacter koreensis]
MASRDKNGKIRGKIDNIVYRGYKDKQIMQISPKRVKQTLSSKLSALEFGLAARQAKFMRDVFHNVYEECDGNMVRRFTATVAACIRTAENEIGERDLHDADLGQLKGFSFNEKAPFEKLVAVSPKLDVAANGSIRFQLGPFVPGDNIVYPPNFFRPNGSFSIFVVAFNFRKGNVQIVDCAGFDVAETDHAPTEIDWQCNKLLPEGYIVLVVLCLRYFSLNWLGQRTQTTNNDFYPSIILDAFHVTPEMAASGARDLLQPPSADDFSSFGDTRERISHRVLRLKTKAPKR